MSQKNIATLKQELEDLLYESGQKHIDPVTLRTRLNDIIDSVPNLTDNITKLGFRRLDPNRSYGSGEGFIYNGAIWESKNGHLPGMNPDNPQGSVFNRLTSVPTIENFEQWDNVTVYNQTNTVRRDFRLFESLVDNNTGNDPLLETYPGSSIWKEVSASENKWGEDYVVGRWYSKRQVVYNGGTFYWLNIVTKVFFSVDFTTELAEGKWVTLGSDGGSAAAEEIVAADITERDLYISQMETGDYIFVTDASADPTVTSGWARYKLNSDDSWTKTAEQESMDLLYQKEGEIVGYKPITDLAYTLLLGDKGFWLDHENINAQTVTIPDDATANFPTKSFVAGQRILQGTLEILAMPGVTVDGITNSLGKFMVELRGGCYLLVKKGPNHWGVSGGLEI